MTNWKEKYWDIRNLFDGNWFPFDLRRVSESEYGEKLISIWLVLSAGILAVATLIYLGGEALSAVINWSHGMTEMWGRVPAFAAVLSIVLAAILVVRRLFNSPIKGIKDRPRTAFFLSAGIFIIFFGAGMSVTGLILPGLLLVLVASATIPLPLKEKNEECEEPKDWLHRKFLANRIAEYLIKEEAPLHRIAVIGPWGEGKTRVLKLIQWEVTRILSQDRPKKPFRPCFVWVNPWKASSKEEAWSVFAEGFKELRSPLGRFLSSPGLRWLRGFLGLFGFESISDRVLEAIRSHFPDDTSGIFQEVDRVVQRRGIRLFLFVDDMERADSDAIRGILPVIDRLSDMKHCFFIFGVDRGRLEDAYLYLDREVPVRDPKSPSEGGGERRLPTRRSMTTVTGYLDKVMDVQLEIPSPARHEIVNFASEWLKEFNALCPKLSNSLKALEPCLPLNARQCEKFLKEATQTELLFLRSYGEEEKNFEVLFLVILGETSFPGFRRALAESITVWPGLADSVFGDSRDGREKKVTESEGFKKFLHKLVDDLAVPIAEEKRLEEILERIVKQFGINAEFTLRRLEDPEWIVSGYLVPRVLPFEHREAIVGAWLESGGKRNFLAICMDEKVLPPEEIPSDRVKAIFQIIEGNLNEACRRLKVIRRKGVFSDTYAHEAKETIQWMNCFAEYFGKGRLKLDPCDREVLSVSNEDRNKTSPAIIAWFEELVQALPIAADAGGWIRDLRRSRVKAFQSVLCSLEPADVSNISTNLLFPDAYRMPEEASAEIEVEYREVAEKGRNLLAELFVKEFPRQKWPDLFDIVSGTGRRLPLILLEPRGWVPLSETHEVKLDFFENLQPFKGEPDLLGKNLFEIVAQIFLRPLSDLNSSAHDLGSQTRRLLCDPASRAKPYLAAFWKAALRFVNAEERNQLLDLRQKLFERADGEKEAVGEGGSTEHSRMRREFVEEAFAVVSEGSDEA